jgi:hypothetical protein
LAAAEAKFLKVFESVLLYDASKLGCEINTDERETALVVAKLLL